MSEEHRSHRLNARRGACGDDEARPWRWKRTIFQDITSAVAHHGAMREISRFIRFAYNGSHAYGLLTNDAVEELKGPPFQSVEPTGRSFPLAAVKLLTPCEPCATTPGQYSNTMKNLFDYVANWINARF